MHVPILRVIGTIGLASVVVGAWCGSLPAAPRATGDKALEDLGSQLLDEQALRELIGPAEQPGSSSPGEPAEDDLRRRSDPEPPAGPADGEDLGEGRESPLVHISNRMAEAGELLETRDRSGRTLAVQEEIVAELDKLIDRLQQQCQQCSGGQAGQSSPQQTERSSAKPSGGSSAASESVAAAQTRAQQEATGRQNPDDEATANTPDAAKQVWGQLPERFREQLLQSTGDEFLPKYREELELYFKRLAEQQQGNGDRR